MEHNTMWDAVVIGAGPAGMAAALTLSAHNCKTLLIDENPSPGGQIYRNLSKAGEHPKLVKAVGADYTNGLPLVEALKKSAVTYWPSSQVWEVTPERLVRVRHNDQQIQIRTQVLIMATGAMERPCPIPGWTLPGVMTVGALQILLKSSGLMPDQPFILVGSGPLMYLLAAQCTHLGNPPAAIVSTTQTTDYIRAGFKYFSRLWGGTSRAYLDKGRKMIRDLRQAKVPFFTGAHSLRILGKEKAEGISFIAKGTRHELKAPIIALHEGVIPQPLLARSLSLPHRWNEEQHCFVPVTDTWGETALENIFIAGDAGGIVGAIGAEAQGHITGLRAAAKIHPATGQNLQTQAKKHFDELTKHLRIRPFLDAVYQPVATTELVANPDPGTIICRCEEVTLEELQEVIRLGVTGPNQTKSFLRSGMGPCQGCMCANTITELLAKYTEQNPQEVGAYRVRPPVKPVSLKDLSKIQEP